MKKKKPKEKKATKHAPELKAKSSQPAETPNPKHEKHEKEELYDLYVQLVRLQNYVISKGVKLLIILEGRDTAGKDGTIKVITRHLSPRDTRVMALPVPSDVEKREWYFQRYVPHLPAEGETVIFNRSWYNRLGVEKVMGYCTDKQYRDFFDQVKHFEKSLVNDKFIIMKYYLDIDKKQQELRLKSRHTDPLKQWKISPNDNAALSHWKEYSKTRDKMLEKTNFEYAPWYVVNANDKDNAHIALISHLLSQLDYKGKDEKQLTHHQHLVTPASDKDLKKKLQ